MITCDFFVFNVQFFSFLSSIFNLKFLYPPCHAWFLKNYYWCMQKTLFSTLPDPFELFPTSALHWLSTNNFFWCWWVGCYKKAANHHLWNHIMMYSWSVDINEIIWSFKFNFHSFWPKLKQFNFSTKIALYSILWFQK